MNLFFTCYIIDHQVDARQRLKEHIDRIPFLKVIGESADPVASLVELTRCKPDLLLLEIDLPEMPGFDFVRTLGTDKCKIIVITANSDYALESYKYEVIDYLLKPLSFQSLLKGIYKFSRRAALTDNSIQKTNNHIGYGFMLAKQDKIVHRIPFEEIDLIEAKGDYIKVYYSKKMVVAHQTLSKTQEQLPLDQFVRINRSYIVRKNAISQIEGNQITTICGKKVVIGVTYRDKFLDNLLTGHPSP